MKYEIWLDDQRVDEFECEENEALIRYHELLTDFKDENVYDVIELFKIESVTRDTLEVKESV